MKLEEKHEVLGLNPSGGTKKREIVIQIAGQNQYLLSLAGIHKLCRLFLVAKI